MKANASSICPRCLHWFEWKISRARFDTKPFEEVFRRIDGFGNFVSELERRTANGSPVIDVKRCHGIFCVRIFTADENKEEGANKTEIKVEKYSSALKCFKEAAEIELHDREDAGTELQKNQIYVLGGYSNDTCLKSVSETSIWNAHCLNSILDRLRKNWLVWEIVSSINLFLIQFWHGGRDVEIFKPMNVARKTGAVADLNGYIYIAGGDTDNDLTSWVELYDSKRNEWLLLAPCPRETFTLIKSNGLWYAIGGYVAMTGRYDLWKNRLEVVSTGYL